MKRESRGRLKIKLRVWEDGIRGERECGRAG